MNIVLQSNSGFYIASVLQITDVTWALRGVVLNSQGKLMDSADLIYYHKRQEAEKACKNRAKVKQVRKMYVPVLADSLPYEALTFLVSDPDSMITPWEMVNLIRMAKKERYVFFKNVTGIEHLFQVGLEYLAHITDDEDILEVESDTGEKHSCWIERFETIEETESAKEAFGAKSAIVVK